MLRRAESNDGKAAGSPDPPWPQRHDQTGGRRPGQQDQLQRVSDDISQGQKWRAKARLGPAAAVRPSNGD